MSLGIEDILEVLGDAQEAGVVDLQGYVSLVTRFTKAIKAQKQALTAAGNVPPSESKRSASEAVSFQRPQFDETPKKKPSGERLGIEVIAYPPDESGQEPPLATFQEKQLNDQNA